MGILAKAGDAMQRLFGEIARQAGQESGVVEQVRKFTSLSLARTFVLGFMKDPNATDEKLAQMPYSESTGRARTASNRPASKTA